ncbi:MAG TPA: sugar phosphate isomerase/epimerase [Chloroflexota bacterium]|nr:sugar phosphate isomerase/epimerase [Chloroflexota bacterium]
MTEDQIAVQLYTLREQTATDMPGTLQRLAEIGYRAVEFAGYGNATPKEIRRVLDKYAMRAASAHVGVPQWEQIDDVLATLQTLGCAYAVVPSLPKEQRTSLAQVKALCEQFNHWSERCRDRGIRFAYHNHAFEFDALEDSTIWETLLGSTDPTLVGIELDVYWAQYAGQAPVELIGRLAGRLPLLHVKDMANTPERADVPAGSGVLDWNAILSAAARAGTEWYIVEQDHPRSAFEDVEASLRFLQGQAHGPSIGTMPHSQPL